MPVAAPDFDLTFGTSTLTGDDKKRVVGLEADLSLHMPDRFEITFVDNEGKLSDDTRFALGTEITVKLGYEGSVKAVGVGAVARTETAISKKGRSFKVIGYGGRYVLQKQVSARAFVDTTIDKGLGQVAQGLAPDLKTSGTAISLDYLMQGGQSTSRFVEEFASRQGRVIMGSGGDVEVAAPTLSKATRTFTWPTDVLDMRLEINTFHQVSEVTVTGVDVKTKKPIVATATDADLLDKMDGSQTGSAAAEAAFGVQTLQVSDMPVRTQAEADALAKALFNDRAFCYVTGAGVAMGDPELKAGGVVKLDKFASRLNGRYYLTRVIHKMTSEVGYISRFQLCRPTLGS